MLIASLVAPACGLPLRLTRPRPVLRHVRPSETQAIAEGFISARTRADLLVAEAYRQLEMQTEKLRSRIRKASTGLPSWARARRPRTPMPGNSPPRSWAHEPWRSPLLRRTVRTLCSAARWAAPTAASGRCMISLGTLRPDTALTGTASTQRGFCSAASTRVLPAGPRRPSCTAKSVRCGSLTLSRSTRRCCSILICSGDASQPARPGKAIERRLRADDRGRNPALQASSYDHEGSRPLDRFGHRRGRPERGFHLSLVDGRQVSVQNVISTLDPCSA